MIDTAKARRETEAAEDRESLLSVLDEWIPALCDEVDALRARVAELEAAAELTRAAYQRGADRFRAAHPEYVERLMWPDTGDLMTWLLEQFTQLETAARALVEVAYSEEGDMGVRWYAVDADYVDALAKVLGIEHPSETSEEAK